jgi:hypothetical protein
VLIGVVEHIAGSWGVVDPTSSRGVVCGFPHTGHLSAPECRRLACRLSYRSCEGACSRWRCGSALIGHIDPANAINLLTVSSAALPPTNRSLSVPDARMWQSGLFCVDAVKS